jgi:hypothetical protein
MAKEIGNWSKQRPRVGHATAKRSAADILALRLLPGEKLLWSSRGSGVRGGFYILSSLFLAVGLTAFLFGVLPPIPSPFGTVVVALVAGYILARAIYGPQFEVYGVTNQRLIILKRFFPECVVTPTVRRLRAYDRGPTGSIIFEDGIGVGATMHGAPHGFYGIQTPVEIGRLIQAQIAPDQFMEINKRQPD